jgi:hypothetical protein
MAWIGWHWSGTDRVGEVDFSLSAEETGIFSFFFFLFEQPVRSPLLDAVTALSRTLKTRTGNSTWITDESYVHTAPAGTFSLPHPWEIENQYHFLNDKQLLLSRWDDPFHTPILSGYHLSMSAHLKT